MIQNHVTSLELSQKLKELGVPQRSEFEWSTTESGNNISLGTTLTPDHPNYKSPFYKSYSAFLSSELGEILPETLEKLFIITAYLQIQKKTDYWYVAYWGSRVEMMYEKYTEAETLSNAMAKMLIYLIENKLIQVESL